VSTKNILSLITFAWVLAAAPVAQAATVSGTALQVNRTAQTLRVVNARHQAITLQTGGLSADVRPGARLRVRTIGRRATSVVVTGHARTVSFLGRVVAAGARGISLRLGDGRAYQLHSHARLGGRDARADDVGETARGASAGDVVLVTTSGRAGESRTTLQVKDTKTDIGPVERHVDGVVSDVDDDGFSIVAGGRVLNLRADADTFDTIDLCDRVAVSYHAAGAAIVADVAVVTTSSGDDGCDEVPDTAFEPDPMDFIELAGTVLSVEPGAGRLSVATSSGPVAVVVADHALLVGLHVGDEVGVVFSPSADPAHIVADDVFSWS
jgi:hypothetical protein